MRWAALISVASGLGLAALSCLAACGQSHPSALANDAATTTVGGDASDADARRDGDAVSTSDARSTSDSSGVSDGELGDAPFDFGDAADMGDVVDLGEAAVVTIPCADAAITTSTDSGASCAVTVQSWPDDGHTHVPVGTTVDYCTVPPESGAHWPYWAAFRSYTTPVPHEMLVHDMEHGAVVVFYQCSGSCPAVASQLQAVIDAQPVDPLCSATSDAGPLRRLILVPDPTLDVPVAAAAWQWTYRAACVDVASLSAFITAHYGLGTETLCVDGVLPP
jgi:hypothetical protein